MQRLEKAIHGYVDIVRRSVPESDIRYEPDVKNKIVFFSLNFSSNLVSHLLFITYMGAYQRNKFVRLQCAPSVTNRSSGVRTQTASSGRQSDPDCISAYLYHFAQAQPRQSSRELTVLILYRFHFYL
jgi:hypothetical protein